MKKTFLSLALLCVATLANALTINNTAGNLATAVGAELTTCTSLIVTGEIDARDFKTMRSAMTALTAIDLSGTTIVAYTGTEGVSSTLSTAYAANTLPAMGLYGKTKLISAILPNSITTIRWSAFDGCIGLASIIIPNTVTTMESSLFDGCTGLTAATIGSSVTTIGYNAFWGCTSLSTVEIPASVTHIGSSAFKGSSGLITVDANNADYSSIDGALYNKSKTDLYYCPISKTGLFVIPNTVTSIRDYALYGCSGLTAIIIPNSVTKIYDGAFNGCSGLSAVTIPNSVISIGSYAFSSCSGLTAITIPSSVTTISNDAFYNFSGLFTVDANNANYSSADGVLYDKLKTKLIQCPISKTGLVTIPNSVTSIGVHAFYNCSGLTSIIIPNTVVSIGDYSFDNCKGLTTVTIPSSVTSIGNYAFTRCTGLTSIKALNTVPTNISLGSSVFNNVKTTTCILYVPTTTVAAYQAANQWKDFTNILESVATNTTDNKAVTISVCITDNRLTITNAPQGEAVMVCNINGTIIAYHKATGLTIEVVLPMHGTYIVKVGMLSEKVIY